MKRLFVLLIITILFQSCDDGDVIITTFDFDDAALKTCGSVGNYVFYKENTQVFESLSLRLGTTDSIYKDPGIKIYELSDNTSFVNYRSYNGPLGSNYFCSSIPPTSPKIESNYLAVSGKAEVTVTFDYEEPAYKKQENPVIAKKTPFKEENSSSQFRSTLRKSVQIILKDLVLISGDNQIILETLDMGTIENVEVVEIIP